MGFSTDKKNRLQGPNISPRTNFLGFLNHTQPILPYFSSFHLQITSQHGSNSRKTIKKCPPTKKTTFFHSWDFPRTLQSSFFLHTQVVWLRKPSKLDHLEVVWTYKSRIFLHLEVVLNCHFRLLLHTDREWGLQ